MSVSMENANAGQLRSPMEGIPFGLPLSIAASMLMHKKGRVFWAVFGIGILVFLAKAQIGLLVGWTNTNTALIRHSNMDLWVMARNTPAWDYGTAIPRQALYQARSVPGVAAAEPLFVAWNTWQRPDGRKVNVELVGLDDALAGGPWKLSSGSLDSILRPDNVIVDELYLPLLGAKGLGGHFELYGRRATIGAISTKVRTFTASPHVFTLLSRAIDYDRRYRSDQITYVLVRCLPTHSPADVQARLKREIDYAEVLTTEEFSHRSATYWMVETGIGITVILTAVLGLAVASLIANQTVLAFTREALGSFGTLQALGFERNSIRSVVLSQATFLGVAGAVLGLVLFLIGGEITSRTPVPLEFTSLSLLATPAIILASCLIAAVPALRLLQSLDPIDVLHA